MNSESDQADNVIDADGYRANVGIIICNTDGKLFWGRRAGQKGWQFPQGGINADEEPEAAMFRELFEEVGLNSDKVTLLGCTEDWLKYKLPERYQRRNSPVICIGQKQIWYLLRYDGSDDGFQLDVHQEPEFDRWRWVDYWYPINHVIYFKRYVYKRALRQLEKLLPKK